MSKEPKVRADFYRALKNIVSGVHLAIYGEYRTGWKVSKVEIEYPVNDKRADIVVFRRRKQGEPNYPFLVIETKGRRINAGPTLARASKQVLNYAEQLNANFFAVYDGWNFLLFEKKYPYLIKLSNFLNVTDYIARDVLSGVFQFQKRYRRKSASLKNLPKVTDGWSFKRKILPHVAKELASGVGLKNSWKVLLEKWSPIIKEDGKW